MVWLMMVVGPLLTAYLFVVAEGAALVQMSGAWRVASLFLAVVVAVAFAASFCVWEHPLDIYRSAVIVFAGGLVGVVVLWVACLRRGRGPRPA